MSNLDETGMAHIRANANRINAYLKVIAIQEGPLASADALTALFFNVGMNEDVAMAILNGATTELPAGWENVLDDVENAFREAGVAVRLTDLLDV